MSALDRRSLLLGGTALAGIALVPFFARLTGDAQGAGYGPVPGDFEIKRTDEEWLALLGPAAYQIMREQGTEPPWSSPLLDEHRKGIFHCAGCDLPLFDSDTKYDSRTGWPSFWQPLDNAVGTLVDNHLFVPRTEVHCRRCGGHLGHVFEDGPPPTGLRYCMDGLSLRFVPAA
jgi:peptide-methionine (R)-S-oxide reductase